MTRVGFAFVRRTMARPIRWAMVANAAYEPATGELFPTGAHG